ncbi:MAG: xanthine dehydrogenase family protein molybdopterin-binding subunit [Fimbriimonadaceae bacterium]|nr:xanthine dehydrogenase family protein molybdopterin-binding subunit [Fimbriimonadaceae bacterium]
MSLESVSRRDVLRVAAVAGTGLVLGCRLASPDSHARNLSHGEAQDGPVFEPNAWLKVLPNDDVVIVVARPDIGQGTRTSMAMIVAEELGVDWRKVKVEQAVADRKYGPMGVGGSASVRGSYAPLRRAGAAAREMLVAAAAAKWGVEASACRAENGVVLSGDNKLAFAALAADAAKLPVPANPTLKDPAAFTIIGKRTSRVDNRDVVTGRAVFGLDVRAVKAFRAAILRPRCFTGRISEFDDTEARKVEGVRDVFQLGTGVVVIGDTTHAAFEGRKRLKTTENPGPAGKVTSASIREAMRAAIQPWPEAPEGKVVEATFELPFLAHAPMEPQNCTVWIHDGVCEIWAPTQVPDSLLGQAARAAEVAPDKVTIHVPLIGGGFGRRLVSDFAMEAIEIAKRVGDPVQLVWSRDDDTRHDYYRPASHHALRAVLDASGKPIHWRHQYIQAGGRTNAGPYRAESLDYGFGSVEARGGSVATPVPTGAWRSVGHSHTGFVYEAFVDELATAAGQDPVAFRLAHIEDPRLRKALELCAEKANWGSKLPNGRGRGVACFADYGSYCVHIVEATMTKGGVKVNRVVSTVDCGIAINPGGVEQQILGGTVDGLSCALRAEITIENGGVVESSYRDFEWFRMKDAPRHEIHRIESRESPGGMGEVGVPGAPAALANAIFAATGTRYRNLPIRLA